MTGPVAVVTGASSGIGAATVANLAARGYRVAAVARRRDRLDALAAEHDGVLALAADITSREQVADAVGACVERFGRIDALVNNAGLMLLGTFADHPVDYWTRMVDLNVVALMSMTHEVLPHLRKAAAGEREVADIVNIGSVAGRTTRAQFAAYNSTKWAVSAFTDALRQEVAEHGVRVSVIQPGSVETELLDHVDPGVREGLAKGMPGLRRAVPADVAETVAFVLSQPPGFALNEIVVRAARQPF